METSKRSSTLRTISTFGTVVEFGEPERDNERRPAARTERALSTGPVFSFVPIEDSLDALLPDCWDLGPLNETEPVLSFLLGVADDGFKDWPNQTRRSAGVKGMVIRE